MGDGGARFREASRRRHGWLRRIGSLIPRPSGRLPLLESHSLPPSTLNPLPFPSSCSKKAHKRKLRRKIIPLFSSSTPGEVQNRDHSEKSIYAWCLVLEILRMCFSDIYASYSV